MTFVFASPWWLLALLLIPLTLWLSLQRQQRPRWRYSWTSGVQGHSSWRVRYRQLPKTLHVASLILLVLALARPQLQESQQVVRGEGIDIALALDISGSMAALDFQPQNRLAAAQQVMAEFIDSRDFDRIGLVVFAREAFNQSPLTTDHRVLQDLLASVELAPDLGIRDGTAIGMGLANAAAMLRDSPGDSKVVILLTDGVNNAGQLDPLTSAEAARALGIRVYTIGAAKPGRVPAPVVNAFGQRQIVYQESVLDEDTLRQIADTTGGLYFRAEDTEGLEAIYEQINTLERSDIEVSNVVRSQELLWMALLPGLWLFLLAQVLANSILRRLP
jgi:Ca-activated chloride channel homolog